MSRHTEADRGAIRVYLLCRQYDQCIFMPIPRNGSRIMADEESLFSKEFLALNAIFFLNLCNVTVFFHLHSYLGTLAIAPHWSGFLMGLFALGALVVRPLAGLVISPANARSGILVGALLSIFALFSYNAASEFWSMALVRIVHGAAFGIIDAAAMTKFVSSLPPKRSGEAFQFLFVFMFLPFGIVPPLLKPLIKLTGSFLHATDLPALLMILVFPLLIAVRPAGDSLEPSTRRHVDRGLMLKDFRDARIWVLFGACLMLYATLAMLFFFFRRVRS